MENFRIELVKDLNIAQNIWNSLNPRMTIYDAWDFRYCFYKYFNYQIFFYGGYIGDELIGLLPLQYNSDKDYYEYFGGDFMEDNRIMIKPGYETYIHEFFNVIPQKTKLLYLIGPDPLTSTLEIKDYKFVLDLTKIGTIEDYIQNYFGSETRRTLRKCFRKITDRKLQILINNFEDMELLFEYNIRQFKEKSRFTDRAYRKEIFRDLLTLPYQPILMTFVIDGVKEGVSFAMKYKNIYESFNTGTKSDEIKHLFAFMIIKNIENALQEGMTSYDAFCADCNWKEKWGFTKIPQYKFEKGL